MMRDRSKIWSLVLLGSLALNVFLGGMWTARWARQADSPALMGGFGMRRIGRALGPEGRPALDKVAQRHRGDIRARMDAAHEAKLRAATVFAEEPFRADRADAALHEFRTRSSDVQESIHKALIELAAELTPEQRRAVMQELQTGPGPWHHPGRRAGGPPAPAP